MLDDLKRGVERSQLFTRAATPRMVHAQMRAVSVHRIVRRAVRLKAEEREGRRIIRARRIGRMPELPDLEAAATSPDNGCGTEVIARLVGDPPSYADTNIPRLLPIGVPQDLVNGREDRIIPHRMATDYVAAAKAKGDAEAEGRAASELQRTSPLAARPGRME